MQLPKIVTIRSDIDIVTARIYARELARSLGFSLVDQARIATSVTELARNIFLYAGVGTVRMQEVQRHQWRGIEIICSDKGPGISNLNLVMQEGYSTSSGMGIGLPGTKRLMDEFDILSAEGVGTTVVCRKWRPYREANVCCSNTPDS